MKATEIQSISSNKKRKFVIQITYTKTPHMKSILKTQNKIGYKSGRFAMKNVRFKLKN